MWRGVSNPSGYFSNSNSGESDDEDKVADNMAKSTTLGTRYHMATNMMEEARGEARSGMLKTTGGGVINEGDKAQDKEK